MGKIAVSMSGRLGGFAASAPPASAFEAKTFEELKAYAQSVGIEVDDGLAGYPISSLQLAVDGIEKVVGLYPSLADEPIPLKENDVITPKGALAYARLSGSIHLNRDRWGSDAALDDLIQRYGDDVAVGFHPQGTDSGHITSHEAGHIVEARLLWAKYPDDGSYLMREKRTKAWNSCSEATSVIAEACRTVKRLRTARARQTTSWWPWCRSMPRITGARRWLNASRTSPRTGSRQIRFPSP